MPDVPPAILPNHKQAVLVFLERVYGVEDSETFFRLLEESFLPDLRAGTMMDAVSLIATQRDQFSSHFRFFPRG